MKDRIEVRVMITKEPDGQHIANAFATSVKVKDVYFTVEDREHGLLREYARVKHIIVGKARMQGRNEEEQPEAGANQDVAENIEEHDGIEAIDGSPTDKSAPIQEGKDASTDEGEGGQEL